MQVKVIVFDGKSEASQESLALAVQIEKNWSTVQPQKSDYLRLEDRLYKIESREIRYNPFAIEFEVDTVVE